jgi:hypothetical protein
MQRLVLGARVQRINRAAIGSTLLRDRGSINPVQ